MGKKISNEKRKKIVQNLGFETPQKKKKLKNPPKLKKEKGLEYFSKKINILF